MLGCELLDRLGGAGCAAILDSRSHLPGAVGLAGACAETWPKSRPRRYRRAERRGAVLGRFLFRRDGRLHTSRRHKATTPASPPPPPPVIPMVFYPFDLNPSGASLGGQLGYNFQFGAWVFGLEGDWSWVFSASDRGFDPAGSGRYDDVTLALDRACARTHRLSVQPVSDFLLRRRGVRRNGSQALRPCRQHALFRYPHR